MFLPLTKYPSYGYHVLLQALLCGTRVLRDDQGAVKTFGRREKLFFLLRVGKNNP